VKEERFEFRVKLTEERRGQEEENQWRKIAAVKAGEDVYVKCYTVQERNEWKMYLLI